MARTVSIGNQDFESLRTKNYFYIDKTGFIREWWDSGDVVTLITRPRRFGKTLNMNMLEKFFSVQYAGRGGSVRGAGDLEGGEVPQPAGDVPGDHGQLRQHQGDKLRHGPEKNVPDPCGRIQ